MSLQDKIDQSRIPEHIAIIMDGNGRWAKARELDRAEGHKQGVSAVRKIVEAASKLKVKYLTIYAFSTENWKRPNDEVNALMDLIIYAIQQQTPDLIKNGVRIKSIGDIKRLPEKTRQALRKCEEDTSQGDKITLILALSYSSKWEITNAVKKLITDVQKGIVSVDAVNENLFENYLTTKGIPHPDLLIRPGGEKRISNFLLWQLAYTEFYFTETYWPDFGEQELYKAILDYQDRERRFGKTSEQIDKK